MKALRNVHVRVSVWCLHLATQHKSLRQIQHKSQLLVQPLLIQQVVRRVSQPASQPVHLLMNILKVVMNPQVLQPVRLLKARELDEFICRI